MVGELISRRQIRYHDRKRVWNLKDGRLREMLVMLTFAKVAENPDMAKREDVLGFHPQKESPYSKLLPYSDVIDEESSNALAEIKEKLAKAVQLRDLKVSANHWTLQLDR